MSRPSVHVNAVFALRKGMSMRLRPLVVSIVGVLFFAGCGSSGDKPSPSPTPTATSNSATPSAAPSPSRTGPLTSGPNVKPGETPPVLDKFAKQHSSAGALAFATYFIKALDWSLATTDPYLLKQISAPSCQACQRYMEQIESNRKTQTSFLGGRITINSVQLDFGSSSVKADYIVKFSLDQRAEVVHRPGLTASTVPASRNLTSYVFVSWIGGDWHVVEQSA